MGNKILKWNNDNCFIEYDWFTKRKIDEWPSKCWFDVWSITHFMITAIIYLVILIVIHKFVKKNKMKWAFWALIILNVLHIIEDILENMQMFSLEYLLWGLYDHDSFQNFIGDILSGLVGSYIVYIVYTKIIKKNKIFT
uniref:Uncharacterized protein n=1 Tax=Mimivirus LCMiAC02 TaxID=2506609 RepID=A0A4D5XFY0_9VIRU|nr:MAG: hypothetical protein LCMiAC02_04260 [Mimivirus LCMiAC02]